MVVVWCTLLKSAVFLDRDGVINECASMHNYIKDWKEFVFIPGVERAIYRLNRADYEVFIVTNQRGVARGIMTLEMLENIHEKMKAQLKQFDAHITDIFICTHDLYECTCRKPAIGMFLQAERKYTYLKTGSFMIGDSLSDIEAGKNYGISTILINSARYNNCADYLCANLLEAVDYILGSENK